MDKISVVSPWVLPPAPAPLAATVAAPAPTDGVILSSPEESHPVRTLGVSAMALLALAGAAPMTAGAAEVPAPPPPTSLSVTLPSLSADAKLLLAANKNSAPWRIDFGTTNDSVPSQLAGILPARDQRPGGTDADDDGWTAGLFAEATRTQGDRQDVFSMHYDLLTQRGAWTNPPGYNAWRTDLFEISAQQNHRVALDGEGRDHLLYGAGVGLQAVGPMGGENLQEWFHGLGRFGGRLGPSEGLQNHYTSHGVTFAPMVTGAVGVSHALDAARDYNVKASLSASLPLGPGMAVARGEINLKMYPATWFTAEAGVHVDAVHSQGSALEFMKRVSRAVHAGSCRAVHCI